jgi:hypothetical protein
MGKPEGATMRQELFPGACWFITGNNSCAKIFWHISHMSYASNYTFPDTAIVVDATARNQMSGTCFLAFIDAFLAFKKCQEWTFFL